MGKCESIDGSVININPQDQQTCFSSGGAKWIPYGQPTPVMNPNSPCIGGTYCNGKPAPTTAIGDKICGAGNHDFYCNGSPNGGTWVDSGMACDEGAVGACPTSCGKMTTCDGTVIPKSKIGAKECGDKGLTYVCGPDGNWTIGGKDGKETCVCMTICPDLKGCDGSMVSKTFVGKEVCGFDRKTHICQSNLIGPPDWTYGKKCACPGDPPEPPPTPIVPAASTPATATKPTVTAPTTPTSDNTMIIGAGLFLLFILIIVVALVFAMRGKRTGQADPSAEFSIDSALI